MNKIWLVAKQEYKRHVFRRAFIMVLLSFPLMISVWTLLVYFMVRMENDSSALGYVDLAGVLSDPVPAPVDGGSETPVDILPYPSEEAGEEALKAGDIQAFYLIPEDFLESGFTFLVLLDDIGEDAEGQFWDFMRANLMAGQPAEAVEFATHRSELVVRTPDGSREFSESQFLNIILPLLAVVGLIILILSSSGYLVGVVAEEKENRTMEVLITTVSPQQLISGKLAGITAVLATQVVTWSMFIWLFLYIAANFLGYEWARNIHVDSGTALLLLAVIVPAYIMVAALMTAIGAMVNAVQEGQQIAGLAGIFLWIPFMFLQPVLESPNSPLVVALSFFPPTAPMTLTMRTVLTVVPTWQMALSLGLLTASAAGAVWLAGRALRLGMLRYGQRLSLREIFRKVK